MEHLDSDAVAILSSMQRHQKELLRKRKFLMGLSDAPDSIDQKKRSHAGTRLCSYDLKACCNLAWACIRLRFGMLLTSSQADSSCLFLWWLLWSMLPETFLRKDDVFYEDVKGLVEKGFGADDTVIRQLINDDNMENCDLNYVSRVVSTLLDDFSNNGLYCLAKIVTGDSVTFDKTRPQMKKVIKKGLLEIHSNQCHSYQVQIQSKISQLLKNSKNFRQNHVNHLHLTLKSHHAAVMNILNGLEDMSSQALSAMHRKLRGFRGYVPQLYPPRSGWTRDRLIDRVRKLCLDMIHQLGEANKLPEPLAKAMTVAGLSTRLASGHQDLYVANFVHVTPELEALQNEIVKAIWSLGRRIKKEEIKTLQQLLDPESEVDSKGLKTAIKNMLIEFLFECNDMDAIPDSFINVLSVINKTPCNPRPYFSKDIIDEEVECILNVGAHLKQILWDYIPSELDQDFADAYMEELEESDDGDVFNDDDDDDDKLQLHTDTFHHRFRFNDFTEEVESTGDPELVTFKSEDDSENTNESSSCSYGATTLADDVECPNTEVRGGEMLVSASSESDSSPLGSPVSSNSANILNRQDPKDKVSVDSVNPAGNSSLSDSCSKQLPLPEYQNIARNQYISLQEVCDQASMVGYQLTGHLLKGFGQMEALGLNWDGESYLSGGHSRSNWVQDSASNSMDKDVCGAVIVQAIRQVMPLFPGSELETVKKFMSLMWQNASPVLNFN